MKALSFYPFLENTNTNTPLAIVLIVLGALCFIGAVVITVYLIVNSKKGKKIDNDVWLTALGGKDNVSSVKGVGSRLSVVLKNQELIDREKLKELGVTSILTMSDKLVLVIEGKAEEIANKLSIEEN